MVVWWLAPLVVGVNLCLWGTVGLLRMCDERVPRADRHWADPLPNGVPLARVAVLMAAHDEEPVIEASLARLSGLIPVDQVFIVSDCSTDRTVELARRSGANVIQTPSNVGKARALTRGIRHFDLVDRFEAVMVLDADTQLDPAYFEQALPLLDDPEVAVVAGCAHTTWPSSGPLGARILIAHRQRIYVLTQLLLKYGQTWRGLSATHIVPGFASVYRTSVLRELDVDADGLIIEDFNMTFEVHTRKLGSIGFTPRARAYTQDPARLRDYVRQTRRWSLGLWQTVRRHRPRVSGFGATLTFMLLELLTSSVMFALLPVVVGYLAVADLVPAVAHEPGPWTLLSHLSLPAIALVVLLPDYLLSCFVAAVERRPSYLLLGVFFVPLRIVDAVVTLYTLPQAWLGHSSGRWVSPARRVEVGSRAGVA